MSLHDDFEQRLKDTEFKLNSLKSRSLLEIPNAKQNAKQNTIQTRTTELTGAVVPIDAKQKLKEISKRLPSNLPPPPPDFEERTVEKSKKPEPLKILIETPPTTPSLSSKKSTAKIPEVYDYEEPIQKSNQIDDIDLVVGARAAPVIKNNETVNHDVLNPVNPYTEAFASTQMQNKEQRICHCFTMSTFIYMITFLLFLSNIATLIFAGIVYTKYNELNTYVHNINVKLETNPSFMVGSDGSSINEAIAKINILDNQIANLTTSQQELLNITKIELIQFIYENYNKTSLDALNSIDVLKELAMQKIMLEVTNITDTLSSNLTTHLELVSDTVNTLVIQNKVSQNDISTLKSSSSQTVTDISKLKTDTTNMNSNIINLTNSLSTTSNSISSLTSTTQTMNTNLNSLQTTIGTLNTQTSSLNTNINTISNTLVQHATNINTVTSLTQNLQVDVATVHNTTNIVNSQVSVISRNVNQLSTDYTQIANSLNGQSTVVNTLVSNVDQNKATISTLVSNVDQNKVTLATLNTNVKKNEQSLQLLLQTFLTAFQTLNNSANPTP